MASPRIIIRFRNVVSGIDTILEHNKIIKEKGYVSWGWWKKESEPKHLHEFEDSKSTLFIINPTEKKLYRAYCLGSFHSSQGNPDTDTVPEYYRDNVELVEGWFKLQAIEEQPYDESLAEIIGQRTFALNIPPSFNKPTHMNGCNGERIPKSSILHLSDLHFGKDHGFRAGPQGNTLGRKKFSDILLDDLERSELSDDIAAIVITGDVTTQGDWSEQTEKTILEELGLIADKLGVSRKNILVCPGNHDVIRYKEGDNRSLEEKNIESQLQQKHERQFRDFVESLTDRHWKQELDYATVLKLDKVNLVISILNSCRIAAESSWTEYGYVGNSGIDTLKLAGTYIKSLKESRKTYGLMSLHHHLLPVNAIDQLNQKGVSLTIDAVNLLDKASEVGVSIALHGHQHCSRVAQYRKFNYQFEDIVRTPITIVAGGSSGVKGERRLDSMMNAYSVIRFDESGAYLNTREINAEGDKHTFLFKDRNIVSEC